METMLSLVDYYNDFITKNKLQERKGIEETLSFLEKGYNVILKAPTGYGKTTLTKILANAVAKGNEIASRVIHVLPLRAIVQDLYQKLIKDAVEGRIYTKSIGAQDMDYHFSPYFMKKVTVTTLDSFIMNLFKLPPTELHNIFKNFGSHYELPRGMIYSSIVIFDEFHLLSEEGKPLTSGLSALKVLSDAGVPIIIMSATIDSELERLIASYLGNYKVVNVNDFKIERHIEINFVNDPISYAKEKVKEGKRILVVFNTRSSAIDAYLKLRDLNPVLIHSKFNRMDRRTKVEKILDKNTKLVISTQVIEAGVDTSFDVLITEASPAHNLIQRAGRVARYGGKGEVAIFPFEGKVYDKEEVDKTMEELEKTKKIDESLLNVTKRDYEKMVDFLLLHDLSLLDLSPVVDSEKAKKIYNIVCGFTRDSGIVLGFPPNENNQEKAIPLTEEEAIKLLRQGNKAVTLEGDIEFKPAKCLSLEMMKNNILGIRINSYDSEIGGLY